MFDNNFLRIIKDPIDNNTTILKENFPIKKEDDPIENEIREYFVSLNDWQNDNNKLNFIKKVILNLFNKNLYKMIWTFLKTN